MLCNEQHRQKVFEMYDALLPPGLQKPNNVIDEFVYNFSYYPVIFKNELQLQQVRKKLEENGVNTRRYFYPSLNLLPQLGAVKKMSCPVSEDLSLRVLCLPMYVGLPQQEVERICDIIKGLLV